MKKTKKHKQSKYPDRPITQKEWLEGYWRWRKAQEKCSTKKQQKASPIGKMSTTYKIGG